MYHTPDEIVEISRRLRKNMTQSEKILWNFLKWEKLDLKFLRQHPLYVFTEDSGQHRFVISDFYNHELKLIIELDGTIHDTSEVFELDRAKEKLLEIWGYHVIRFSNEEVQYQIEKVLLTLKQKIQDLKNL